MIYGLDYDKKYGVVRFEFLSETSTGLMNVVIVNVDFILKLIGQHHLLVICFPGSVYLLLLDSIHDIFGIIGFSVAEYLVKIVSCVSGETVSFKISACAI